VSAEDRAKQALETLARALASEGTLRASVRDLRSRITDARVRLLDQVVSSIAQHPVNTQPRRLFKQAASLAAEALSRPSDPPRPASPVEVRSPPTPPPPAAPPPKAPVAKAPEPKRAPAPRPEPKAQPSAAAPPSSTARLVLMARDPEWLYAYWESSGAPEELELVLFDADTGVRVDEVRASSSDLHASFRRPGAGRRFAAIVDAGGKIRLRSGVVEVPSATPAPIEPVRFVAPQGRAPSIVAAAIVEAPYVSPARILGWSPDLWRSFAERVAHFAPRGGGSPGSA
jgi:hypothetical protein